MSCQGDQEWTQHGLLHFCVSDPWKGHRWHLGDALTACRSHFQQRSLQRSKFLKKASEERHSCLPVVPFLPHANLSRPPRVRFSVVSAVSSVWAGPVRRYTESPRRAPSLCLSLCPVPATKLAPLLRCVGVAGGGARGTPHPARWVLPGRVSSPPHPTQGPCATRTRSKIGGCA